MGVPNGRDVDPVSYGRWQEAHRSLTERVTRLEQADQAADWAAAHQRFALGIRELREDFDTFAQQTSQAMTKRRDRQWTLMIAFLTGLALPLLVLAVVTVASAHLH